MSDDKPPPNRLLLILASLLACTILAPILFTLVRGIGCMVRGESCPFAEYQFSMEQFGVTTAALIALLMALMNKKD